MSEPKYKLNKKDSARWQLLCTRHCLEGHRRSRKYPPLTPEERAEFEALDRKRHQKVVSHPRVRAALRRQRRLDDELQKTVKRLKRLLAPVRKKLKQLKIKVD